eukprot:COSAG01_NODE_25983_length_727_cov_0.707006_1_plen_28_part_10
MRGECIALLMLWPVLVAGSLVAGEPVPA